MRHLQPEPHFPGSGSGTHHTVSKCTPYTTEPVWTQMIRQTSKIQYLLFWYIAETLPTDIELLMNEQTEARSTPSSPTPYQIPPRFPPDLLLAERIRLPGEDKDPHHHENTGVDSDEALYESHLLPIEEALKVLKGTIAETVVRSGWQGICLRHEMELAERAGPRGGGGGSMIADTP